MLLALCVISFEILSTVTSHKDDYPINTNNSASFGIDFSNSKTGVLGEINAEIPHGDKTGFYYFVITMFVISTVAATILTGAFLVLAMLLWYHFKSMKFFWFLTQLTFSVFVVATLNLVINVPATLFSMITKDFVTSDVFIAMSYIIDMCHYTLLSSNLVIAVQRFFVFFVRHLTDRVFDTPFIFLWMGFVWGSAASVVSLMAYNNCRYKYTTAEMHYVFYCEQATTIVNLPQSAAMQLVEIILQVIIPIMIFCIYISLIIKILLMKKSLLNKTEIAILKQAFVIFLLFQISSFVFIFCQTFTFDTSTAFIIKRIINTTEILAGAATPSFFFFTSKDVRKLLSTRVSAVSSQNNSQIAVRRQTIRSY